jgi:exonuclease I
MSDDEPKEKWTRRDKLQLWQIIITALSIFISVGVSAYVISKQINSSSELSWKDYLDNKETQLFRMEVDNPVLACTRELNIYGFKRINYECTKILRNPHNLAKALLYIDEVTGVFQEVKEIGDTYDKEYPEYYQDWVDEVGKQDITAFYLYKQKINGKDALERFGITIKDKDIEAGYLRFKKRIGG